MSEANKAGIYVIQAGGWEPYLVEVLEGPADQDIVKLFDAFLDETGYTGRSLELIEVSDEQRDAFIEWLGQKPGWRVVNYDNTYIGT